MSTPLVSVIIPAYRAARTLGGAVDSVLAQTMRDYELIVVDDASPDDTPRLVQAYGPSVRLIRLPTNRGVSAARNAGIDVARGAWLAFLDADDAWEPEKLERQLAALSLDSRCQACHTAVWLADASLRRETIQRRNERRDVSWDNLLIFGNLVLGGGSSAVCSRDAIKAHQGFDEALGLCADWDMWLRISRSTRFAYVDEPLTIYRRSPGSMSRDPSALERDTLLLLRKAFSTCPGSRSLRARAYGRQYRVLAGSYLRSGHRAAALRCLARAAGSDPRQLLYALAMPWRAARRRATTPES